MAEVCVVFAAPDDEGRSRCFEDGLGSPVHNDDGLRPEVLAELEALLTGRNSQEIAADPRHGAQVTEVFNEDAGVVEAGILTITDTLTRALAAVARYAAARGYHVYSFWYF